MSEMNLGKRLRWRSGLMQTECADKVDLCKMSSPDWILSESGLMHFILWTPYTLNTHFSHHYIMLTPIDIQLHTHTFQKWQERAVHVHNAPRLAENRSSISK